MGISGLLPLLKSIQKPCSLKKFAGQTIGVDAYGWLHRGTVACAIDLALGKPTTKYVDFSMHRVRMLLHFGVIPYIVFDGDYLPNKAATEVERAKRREESKRKGLEFYRLNKPSQAHFELQKAVDVTPEMARQLIDELKRIGIQYVVAPYEADAQLVYLERKEIIHGILSEDSDLLVFGAKRLLTKLDQYGDCVEISRTDFTACREISLVGWSDAEFRRMAILSGCDYLASINRMGLKSAYRFVRKYKTIEKIIQMLQFDGQYHVPTDYLTKFHKAELTFLHQRVFCPLKNDVVMMTDLGFETQPEDFSFIGHAVEQKIAIGVAKGDLDPMTKQPIHVRSTAKSSPKMPWGDSRRIMLDTFSDTKSNKSIETFFKAKRTPLAELNPNSFTPSPTQQRLLQQANGTTWTSSSAPAGPAGLRSGLSIPSTSRPALSTGTAQSMNSTVSALSRPASAKRRRLCLDPDDGEELGNTLNPEVGRSRFFASKIMDPSPLNNSRSEKRGKGVDITIWSDDSVEDVMAGLPDVSESQEQGKKAGFEIFNEDSQEKSAEPLWAEIRHERRREGLSRSSTRSRGTLTSEMSTSTTVSSVRSPASSVAQTLRKHIDAELKTLSNKHTDQSETGRVEEQHKEIQKGKECTKPNIASHPPNKPILLRQRSMTPLQRLSVGALNRPKSCSELISSPLSQPRKVEGSISSQDRNASTQRTPGLSVAHNMGRNASITNGSEDSIIPDSEDSGDDILSEVGDHTKPRISLGHFAFKG